MLEIRLCGGFEAKLNDRRLEFDTRISKSLLAFLAFNAGSHYDREWLAGQFWPDAPSDAHARANLRGALKRVRDAIEPQADDDGDYIVSDRLTVALQPRAPFWCDVRQFREASNERATLPDLLAAAELYQTGLLPDIYDEWTTEPREALRVEFGALLRRVLDRLADEPTDDNRQELLRWGDRWTALDPIDEDACRAVMRAHLRTGNRAAAQRAYERCAEALRHEFGSDAQPEPATAALLDGQAASAARRDATDAPRVAPTNLRQQPTSFVGREADVKAIVELLQRPACRLITLKGIAGIGKTLLALHVAGLMLANANGRNEYLDGVFVVELAPLADVRAVMTALAAAVGFSFYGQNTPRQQLLDHLREKRMLLVLDSVEHLIGADAGFVEFIEEVLANSRGVKFVATTRELMRSEWEYVFDIEGLSVPEAGPIDIGGAHVFGSDSEALFIECARQVNARFDPASHAGDVVRICRLALGMPLALRLAGSQTRDLTCAQIADGLERSLLHLRADDAYRRIPERQRSLVAAIDYSWALLDETERGAFAKLSVVLGDFDADAADAIASADVRLLSRLTDKSLLQRAELPNDGARWNMHEALRQFAFSKLELAHAQVVASRDAMSAHFLRFAQAHRAHPEQLSPDWANMLAGMKHFRESRNWPGVSDYADALREPWALRGRLSDARQGLMWACEAARALSRYDALVEALLQLSRVADSLADFDASSEALNECLAVCEARGDAHGKARALCEMANLAVELSDHTAAKVAYQRALALGDATGDDRVRAIAMTGLAHIEWRNDDWDVAQNHCAAALPIHQRLEDWRECVKTTQLMALIALDLGSFDQSLDAFDQALAYCRRLDDQYLEFQLVETRAQTLRRMGRFNDAHDDAQRAAKFFRALGDRKSLANAVWLDALVLRGMRQNDSAVALARAALSSYRELHDKWAMVRVLTFIGDVELESKRPASAVEAWREGLALANEIEDPQARVLSERLRGAGGDNRVAI